MEKIAIIGAGISGLSVAHFLSDRYDITVFEKENRAGGLIRCLRVNGNLFHICGGHGFGLSLFKVKNFQKQTETLVFLWIRAIIL